MDEHLADSTLNEYLDSALTPARRAEVESHLAACPECSARLDRLRALFASLDSLPETRLERNLASGVLSAIREHSLGASGLNPRPSRPLTPALRFLVAAQGILALILLAVSIPFATRFLQSPEFTQLESQATTMFSNLYSSALIEWNFALAEVQRIFASSAPTPNLVLAPLPTFELTIILLAAGILWLVGNGVLLKEIANSRRLSAFSRK